jgi:hypothetical protein
MNLLWDSIFSVENCKIYYVSLKKKPLTVLRFKNTIIYNIIVGLLLNNKYYICKILVI